MGTGQAGVKLRNENIRKFIFIRPMPSKRLKRPLWLFFALAFYGFFATGQAAFAAEPGGPLAQVSSIPELPGRNPLSAENVQLTAVLAPGKPPLSDGVYWKVYEGGETGVETDAAPVWAGGGAPELRLKPGRYLAEATYGLARGQREFVVPDAEPVNPVLSLNAATLKVHAVAAAGGPKLDGMFYALRETEGDEFDGDLVRSSLSEAVFHVPAGRYALTAHRGLASVKQQVSAEAGQVLTIEIQMEMGEVTLSAHARKDGAALDGATFFVYEAGESGQNREIIRSQLAEPTFSLPAGRYRMAAALGMARAEADLTVEAGDAKRGQLVLNGGSLRLRSLLAGSGQPLDRNVLYRIYGHLPDNGGPQQGEILRSTVAAPVLFLPSGRYRVESQYGWHNARQTSEIEIRPGNVTEIDFEHKASKVRLRLLPHSGGRPLGPVKWTVKNNGSGTVVISQDTEPELILQDGAYQAVAQHGSNTYTQVFDAQSNNDQIVEITVR